MSARTLLLFRADSTIALLYRGSDLFKIFIRKIPHIYKQIMTGKNCNLRAFEARRSFFSL